LKKTKDGTIILNLQKQQHISHLHQIDKVSKQGKKASFTKSRFKNDQRWSNHLQSSMTTRHQSSQHQANKASKKRYKGSIS
jgi:hypothetical protein